jgi:hypothetical protein
MGRNDDAAAVVARPVLGMSAPSGAVHAVVASTHAGMVCVEGIGSVHLVRQVRQRCTARTRADRLQHAQIWGS